MTTPKLINDCISEKVKNCPCCNGEAYIFYHNISPCVTKIWISCTKDYCNIQTSPVFIDEKDAPNVKIDIILDMIKRWNRRVKEED